MTLQRQGVRVSSAHIAYSTPINPRAVHRVSFYLSKVSPVQLASVCVMPLLHLHSTHRSAIYVPARPVLASQWHVRSAVLTCKASSVDAAKKYAWNLDGKPNPHKRGDLMQLSVTAIRRPLGRTRSNDQDKVQALMDSIEEIGLKEPIDILEVDGKYYGFSGCHRYEAFQRLGIEKIPCKVRKANQNTLKMHMM